MSKELINLPRQETWLDKMNGTSKSFPSGQPESLEGGYQRVNLFQNKDGQESLLDKSNHPLTVIFHFTFRTLALCTYLFCFMFTSSFVWTFILTVILLAFDFWTVKNVSGRLLVGLRWWNEVKPDGTNSWIFESSRAPGSVNTLDHRLFWWSLYGYLFIWSFFALTAVLTFKLSWLLIVCVALALNLANVIGYTRCDKDAKKKWMNGIGGSIIGNIFKNQLNSVWSTGSSSATSSIPKTTSATFVSA